MREAVVPDDTTEQQILAILTSQGFGETIEATYRRKERELATLFATLDRAGALALHRRFSEPRDHDRVATAFMRLVIDRRIRLLAVLAKRR